MSKNLVWNGTPKEAVELLQAIQHWCTCTLGPAGERLSACAGHTMLREDQRAIDHLVFVRRTLGDRLHHEEFDP